MEESTTRNFIPEEYKFAHEYCFFLHDLLADIVVVGEQEQIFHHNFQLKNPAHAEQMNGRTGDELASWMEQNGYITEFREANRRHICIALLADFCQFIFEALDCSRKGKLVVSYALLRKPLKENLFYFEWLLADPADFINRFHAPLPSKKKQKRALPNPTQLTEKERLEIIRNAMGKTGVGEWISPEFVHELRYDKNVEYGLEWLFQRANHLITTFVAETEEQNFNFIFSDDQARLSQWKGLYTLLPVLLLHAVNVIFYVVESFNDGKLKDLEFLKLRAQVGFLIYGKNSSWGKDLDQSIESLLKSFSELELSCLNCSEFVRMDFENLQNLYNDGVFVCQHCGYKTLLTSRKELIVVGHLMQGKINCPSCNSVVEAHKENIDNVLLNMKVVCQGCKEEIDLVDE